MNKTHTDFQPEENPPRHEESSSPMDPSLHKSTNPMDLNKSIILYDDGDWSKGHYESIFALFTQACLKNGLRVSAACPRPDLIRNYIEKHCPEQMNRCSFHPVNGRELKQKYRRLKPLTRTLWWARAGRVIRKVQKKDDHQGPVFLMNINHLRGALRTDRLSDRLMPCDWSAFIYDSSCVRKAGRSSTIPALQKQFNFLNASRCRSFGVTDEKMVQPMREAFSKLRIHFIPDSTPEEFSDTLPLADKLLEHANGRKIAGLLGMLHKRKGLLSALKLAEVRPDVFFLFAGAVDLDKMTAEEKTFVEAMIERRPENCFFHMDRIDAEADFNALVRLVDTVLAVYPGFTNSSGLLTKAGLFGKPCLVAEGDTCMADRLKKYNLGLAVPAGDIEAASQALSTLLSNAQDPAPLYEQFACDFGESSLQSALAQLVS